jgi:hypothetical protein
MTTNNADPHAEANRKAREALQNEIRKNLSPEGVATIIAFLQTSRSAKPQTDEQRKALAEAEWFADVLTDMLGIEELQQLFDDLCL